jgi:hypothetical protein
MLAAHNSASLSLIVPGRAFRTWLGAATLLAVAAAAAPAQVLTVPFDKRQQWFFYNSDHAVTSKWSLHFDGSWRQMNSALWNQWVVRPGVNYQLTRSIQLSAAYGYFNSHPNGLASTTGAAPEHRLQQQILMGQPVGKLLLRHRYRFDQRFLGSGHASNRDRTWNLQHRTRYMVRTDIPLKKGKDERAAVYLGLYNEFFLRFGYAGQSAFDQNRIYAGIGLRPSRTFGIETGVFNQRFQPMTGGRMENNYVLVVTFINQVPLKDIIHRNRRSATAPRGMQD